MMKSFSTRVTIEASPEAVWQLLTDARGYPEWNRTVDRVDGRIALGEIVTVHAKIAAGRSFPVTVAALEAPHRMVWTSRMPLGLFEGRRTMELRSLGVNSVEFKMHEDYTGLMASLITKSIPNLQPSFDEIAACLKSRAESA